MKHVTTAQPYRSLVIERDDDGNATKVVGRTPLKVSNDDADRIVKLGESVGVAIRVADADDDDETADPAQVAAVTPDLSAGVGSITGGGGPVTNDESGVTSTANEAESGTARKAKGGK